MKHSELWRAIDTVYGSAYGRSLVQDLVLTGLGRTAQEALDAGESPRRVWDALCDETQASERQRWVYREDPRQRS